MILPNGLVDDINYYMASNENRTLGKYEGIIDHPIRDYRNFDNKKRKQVICTEDYEVLLFTGEYKSLRIDSGNVRDLYIDSDVINAFSMINEKNWKNCVSVPTQHTKILLKEISEKEIDADWFMFHLQGEFEGKIFMPYETNDHWCLFIVDVDKRVLLHIDFLQNEKKNKTSR
ncbi:hypothetical protein TSAR_009658 [Trichomalopsis sarcophagae]|uniref:Ubiquitin-like protease family profile domain-containing protein n=1 Tax=Trichomalopsis sarcophagae TaxID=543379 RepID=A0A232ELP2_9HYME|nr:hypothetical protein TSAR_009658 [Trichomalopsis sarcophagae]